MYPGGCRRRAFHPDAHLLEQLQIQQAPNRELPVRVLEVDGLTGEVVAPNLPTRRGVGFRSSVTGTTRPILFEMRKKEVCPGDDRIDVADELGRQIGELCPSHQVLFNAEESHLISSSATATKRASLNCFLTTGSEIS